MQIKRDYSQPFFGSRRRRRGGGRLVFFYGLFMGALLVFVYTQFDRLQLVALDAVGLAPTPTPFASDLATEGAQLFQAGKVEAAAELFGRALQQQPDNLNYLYEYGKLIIELDRADTLLDPVNPYYNNQSIVDRAIELNPQDPRGYALKAKALVWEGEATEAIPVGVAGLEQDSSFAPLLAVLARAYTSIGRYQQGLDYGQEAIDADPMDVDAHRSYAYSLIWVGARQEAIAQLEDAIAINPNLTAPYFELAGQYLAADMNELAIATYDRILSLDPNDPKAYLRMCESYFKVGQSDRAEGYCADALTADDTYAPAWRQVGMARYNRRNYEGAIEAFEACVANGSEEIQCWYLRGLAHYYLGECDDAWGILNESLTMLGATTDDNPVVGAIREGLRLTTISCPRYVGRTLPTAIPPTPIPPTPIGG